MKLLKFVTFLIVVGNKLSDDGEEESVTSSQHLLRVHKFVVASKKADHLFYFQCFDDTIRPDFVDIQDPSHEQREILSCCDSFFRAIGQMVDDNTTWTDFTPFCQQGPAAQSRLLQDVLDSTSMLPSHSLIWSSSRRAASGVFPPPLNNSTVEDDEWKHFLWDDRANRGQWLDEIMENEDEQTPTMRNFLVSLVTDSESSFSAHLHSTLAHEGGMHRDLHHNITLKLPEEARAGCRFSLGMLLHLPSDVFINVEDAFGHVDSSLDVSLASESLIDQEEPAFVSPQHAVVVELQGRLDESRIQEEIQLEFDTKLHLRYPMPLDRGDFCQISMPSPVLVSGKLTADDGRSWPLQSPHRLPTQPPIHTWTAAGRKGDYLPVLGLTLSAAIMGAAVMLRDIVTVAQ